jgi:hypothetical protein
MARLQESPEAVDAEHPRHWLCATSLYDLEDPKLRLRVRALTQLCKNEREKALALYGFVKRLPLSKRIRLQTRTAREVYDAGRGDAPEKATLLVTLLRIAGIPARVRYVTLSGEILRGVTGSLREADRPLVEAWLHDRWQRTDTFIFDAECMAAARQRLRELGWEWGFGIHVGGAMVWNGYESAFVGGAPTECDLMVVRDLGVFRDETQYLARCRFGKLHLRLARMFHWNLLTPLVNRAWRKLREAPGVGEAQFQKTL